MSAPFSSPPPSSMIPPPAPSGSLSSPSAYATYPPPAEPTGQPLPTATPTLKVMRLQAPQLGMPNAGSLGPSCLLGPSCTLPDTFGVIHIGETFTAYLGVLNADNEVPIRSLTVMAQLQTPSRRWPLPCGLEGVGSGTSSAVAGGQDEASDEPSGPLEVPPGSGVDAIVSRALEEVGQHILRVEVAYGSGPTSRTLRKFYRFNVSSPLHIRELTVRAGDDRCYVSIAVENASGAGAGTGTGGGGLTISAADFHPPAGLVAERVGGGIGGGTDTAADGSDNDDTATASAVSLYETSGRLEPGESYRYLFLVRAASEDAALRGIACGDELGKAVFAWRKAMGEAGRIASASVRCPPAQPPGMVSEDGTTSVVAASSKFVVHRSGLSVDAAAAAANRLARGADSAQTPHQQAASSLNKLLPITVEPIDPPSRLVLGQPAEIKLLVVNHSGEPMNLQLQMRLAQMSGVVVCGRSFKNLGEVPPSGGSSVVDVRVVALVTGLFYVQGCSVVDLTSGREVPQPPLFNVFVERKDGISLEQ